MYSVRVNPDLCDMSKARHPEEANVAQMFVQLDSPEAHLPTTFMVVSRAEAIRARNVIGRPVDRILRLAVNPPPPPPHKVKL